MTSPNAVPIAPSPRVSVSARGAPVVRFLGALVILLAGWYAFAPALHGDWVWDADAEIVQNTLIKDPAGLDKIWRGEVLPDHFPLKSTYKEFAVALFFAGRSAEALDYYDRGLQLAPDPETPSNYGVALAGAGRVNEAMPQYERSLRLKPGYPEAHFTYGIALAASGRPEVAKVHYEAALKAQPERAEPHYNLGRALLQLGRRAPAEAAFVEALRLKPVLAEARQQLEALRQGANPP